MDADIEPVADRMTFRHFVATLWHVLVIRPIIVWQAYRCERAKDYLLRHDHDYRFDHVSDELVRRRNMLYQRGVDPLDPKIPDRFDIEEEMPDMSWPHQ